MEKESISKKVERALFSIILILFLVSAIFFFGFFMSSVSLWVQSGFQDIRYLIVSPILFLMSVSFSVGVYKIESKFRIVRVREKLTRSSIKRLAYFLIPFVGNYVVFYVLSVYFKLFPATMSKALTMEILKVIVQTNGFLIGFSGIVFAQMFWAIHNQQNNIQMKILEFSPSQNIMRDTQKRFLAVLELERKLMIACMFIVVILFVISIFLSLIGMSQTEVLETLPTDPYLLYPFVSMSAGIVLFVTFMAQSNVSAWKT